MTGPLSERKVERLCETYHTETCLSEQQSQGAHPRIFSPLIFQVPAEPCDWEPQKVNRTLSPVMPNSTSSRKRALEAG